MSVQDNLQNIIVLCVVGIVAVGLAVFLVIDNRANDNRIGDEVVEVDDEGAPVGGEDEEPDIVQDKQENPTGVSWFTYTNDEYGFSFSSPNNLSLIERNGRAEVLLQEGARLGSVVPRFSVVVLAPVAFDDILTLPETLFYEAHFPDDSRAWFNSRSAFDYKNDYFIDAEKTTLAGLPAVRVRERHPDQGEYRSLIYVVGDEYIYRVTRDIVDQKHTETFERAEYSLVIF